jgi:hypothetical protein
VEAWAQVRWHRVEEESRAAIASAVGRLTAEGMELAAAPELVPGVRREGGGAAG